MSEDVSKLKDLYLYNMDIFGKEVERIFRIRDVTYKQCVEITKEWWTDSRGNDVVMLSPDDDFRKIFDPHDDIQLIDIDFENWKEQIHAS